MASVSHPPSQGLIAVNGSVFPAATAQIPATDRGALYGDAVFETMVAFGGQILRIDQHLARLRQSAERLGIALPWSDEALTFELRGLAETEAKPKLTLRLVVSRGSGLG